MQFSLKKLLSNFEVEKVLTSLKFKFGRRRLKCRCLSIFAQNSEKPNNTTAKVTKAFLIGSFEK